MRALLLLLLFWPALVIADAPVLMVSVSVVELKAMKDRNDELYLDNYILAQEVQRLTTKVNEQTRELSLSCGRFMKASTEEKR